MFTVQANYPSILAIPPCGQLFFFMLGCCLWWVSGLQSIFCEETIQSMLHWRSRVRVLSMALLDSLLLLSDSRVPLSRTGVSVRQACLWTHRHLLVLALVLCESSFNGCFLRIISALDSVHNLHPMVPPSGYCGLSNVVSPPHAEFF